MKKLGLILVLAVALFGAHASFQSTPAHATLHNGWRYIDGKCGLHKGAKVIPTLRRYHVRIHACGGYLHILLCSPADWPCDSMQIAERRSDWWKAYNPWRWNWYGVLDLGVDTTFTYTSCSLFGSAFVGELPTGGADTIVTAAAGWGCVKGAMNIANDFDQNFGTRR